MEYEDVNVEPRQMPQLPPKPEPKPEPPKKSLSQVVDNWNNRPEVRDIGIMAIKKSTFYTLLFITIFTFLLLIGGVVWFNLSFQEFLDKDFSDNIVVEAPITNNNHTINIQNTETAPLIDIYNYHNITVRLDNEVLDAITDLREALENVTV